MITIMAARALARAGATGSDTVDVEESVIRIPRQSYHGSFNPLCETRIGHGRFGESDVVVRFTSWGTVSG
jgi:hypothetical protein